jgi:hypothetical protein
MTTTQTNKDQVELLKEQRDFVEREKIEKYLTCPICTEIFDNPIRISCGHTFCDDCLSEWGKKSNFCPLCRKQYSTQYSGKDLIAQSIINDAIVNCIYKGCPWRDKLSNLKSHIHTCIFDPAHLPEFMNKTNNNKIEEKKNESDEDAKEGLGEIPSFNVNSSLKQRIFARNPELVKNAYSLKEEQKEVERDEDDNEIIQLPRSELPVRARRGRPKANHRPIFAVHNDPRNTQRSFMRNMNRNNQRVNQRNLLNNSNSLNNLRANSNLLNRLPRNNNVSTNPKTVKQHKERKNAVGITFNQSLINPNVNHIINPSSSSINFNNQDNSRPAPVPGASSNPPRPVQRNNSINSNSNNNNQNNNPRPIQRSNNNNLPRTNPINHNHNSNHSNNNHINNNHINNSNHVSNHNNNSQNKNNQNINNRINNNQRINPLNSNQRLNQMNNNQQKLNQQKSSNAGLLFDFGSINPQKFMQKNLPPNLLNNSLHNSHGNIRLNHNSNHINNHPKESNHNSGNIGPINTVLNNQIERILEMNSGKGKVNPLPENKSNGVKNNNKINGTKDNKASNQNGTNFSNKMTDPKDFYQIISQRVNGGMDSGMNKKNGKKKNKGKDDDLNDFKLLGRKTSKP